MMKSFLEGRFCADMSLLWLEKKSTNFHCSDTLKHFKKYVLKQEGTIVR